MTNNLLAATGDPSFETGTGNPSPSANATYARVASTEMGGAYVGQLTVTTDGAATLSLPGSYSPPVTVGSVYSISAYVQWRVGTPKQVRIDYRWLDSARTVLTGSAAYGTAAGTNGTLLGQATTMTATGAAGQIRVTFPGQTAPTGAAYLNIRFGLAGSPLANDVVWFDQVQIEKSATVSSYNETVPPAPITGYPLTYKLDGLSATGTPSITTSTGGTGDALPDVITGTPPKIYADTGWANNPCVMFDQAAGTAQVLKFTSQGAVPQWSLKLRLKFGAEDATNGHSIIAFLADDNATVIWRLTRTATGYLRAISPAGTILTSTKTVPKNRWLHLEITNDSTATDTPMTSLNLSFWDTRTLIINMQFSSWTGSCGSVWYGNEKTATAPAESWYGDGLEIVQGTVAPTWTETYDARPLVVIKKNGVVKSGRIAFVKKSGVMHPVVGDFVVRVGANIGSGTSVGDNTPTGAQLTTASGTLTTIANPDPSGTISNNTGLVLSNLNSDFTTGNVFWTCNGTDTTPRVFAYDGKSPYSITATYTLGGLTDGVGFADMAESIGPTAGLKYLYVLQVPTSGTTWYAHRFPEPTVGVNQAAVNSSIVASSVVTFSITAPFTACAAFFVDPLTGDLFLVEKKGATSRPVTASVYGFSGVAAMVNSRTIVGSLAGTITGIQDSTNNSGLTGADISVDGRLLVVANFQEAWFFNRPTGQTLAQMLADSTKSVVHTALTSFASEAIALDLAEDPPSFFSRATGASASLKQGSLTYDSSSGGGGGGTGGSGTTGQWPALNVLHLAVDSDNDYPDSGGTNYYLQQAQATIPTATMNDMKSRLANGQGIFVTITTKQTPNTPANIYAGEANAMTFLNNYVASLKILSDYAMTLPASNPCFIAASLYHESMAQVNQQGILGSGQDFGRAQQIFGQKLKAAVPSNGKLFWIVWIVASNRAFEAAQMAELTSPRPDILSFDPYANANGTQTPASIAAADLDWYMQQPAYGPGTYFAVTETAMATNVSATEAQLATFYTNWGPKWKAVFDAKNVPLCAVVFFNSDVSGSDKTHVLTQAAHPQAFAAMTTSLKAQARVTSSASIPSNNTAPVIS